MIILSFVKKNHLLIINVDSYFVFKFEDFHISTKKTELVSSVQKNLIYYIDRVIDVQRLYISLLVIKNIIFMTHNEDYSDLKKIY